MRATQATRPYTPHSPHLSSIRFVRMVRSATHPALLPPVLNTISHASCAWSSTIAGGGHLAPEVTEVPDGAAREELVLVRLGSDSCGSGLLLLLRLLVSEARLESIDRRSGWGARCRLLGLGIIGAAAGTEDLRGGAHASGL